MPETSGIFVGVCLYFDGYELDLCLLRTLTKKQFYPHVLGEIWDFLREISPVSTDFYLSGFICHD